MEEKFVYLMHASGAICKLTQQRLREAGIESRLEDYSQNAFFRIYGSNAWLGKKVAVPESRLAEAKELLNITENERDSFTFSHSKRPFYKFVKILITISLLILFSLYIYSFISNLQNF